MYSWKKILIVIEGIYSMEGETPTLKEIIEVKKKYKVILLTGTSHISLQAFPKMKFLHVFDKQIYAQRSTSNVLN